MRTGSTAGVSPPAVAHDHAEHPSAHVPRDPTPARIAAALPDCRACDLWEDATQPVPGRGPADAPVMLIGEQPGDREDREGQPFVGPAGRILDAALESAGLTPDQVFVTNAVKHFRYRLRGKRRIHQSPDRWQVNACLPWLRAELAAVRPRAVVCLGATAARGLLGPGITIGRDRGRPLESPLAELVTVTAHPSSILRLRERAAREAAMAELVADLAEIGRRLAV
jgi:DNA polymerase